MARLLVPLALLALAPAATYGPDASPTVLRASVGPGYTISLTDAAGHGVTALAPGAYVIEVDDLGPDHNFHLHGSKLNLDSGQDFVGKRTWEAELGDGFYTFVCDPHTATMNGSFVVGTPPEPQLLARVGPGSTIALTRPDGSALTIIDPGTYAIRVEDRTSLDSFRLSGPGVSEHTQVHDLQYTTTWLVTLSEGVYHYFSESHPARLKGSFTVGAGTAVPASPLLRAEVGSDIALTVVNADFSPTTTVEPGRYTIEVEDLSIDHNFHLTGPRVDRATEIRPVGKASWAVTLSPGRYSFVCDPHQASMFGSFTVAGPSTPGGTGRLTATLTASGRASLRDAGGNAVATVRAGRYALTVHDRSAKVGFRIVGPGVDRRTGASFRGTTTWQLELRRGSYRYGTGAKLRTLRVS